MELTELRNKNQKELLDALSEKRKELENIAIEVLKGKNKNVKLPRMLRKDIARIKTILGEKEILKDVKDA